MKFALRAVGNIAEPADQHARRSPLRTWIVRRVPALFVLVPEGGVFPTGWVLFEGVLIRRASDFTARLYYDIGGGFNEAHSIAPPISHKGSIHELIWLPRGIRALRWQAMNSPGEFEQSLLTMRKVFWIERVARMILRIVPALIKHPRRKRKKIGLTLWRMLVDLRGTYRAAGLLLACTPPPCYQDWIKRFDTLTPRDHRLILRRIARFEDAPLFSVLLRVHGNSARYLQAALESVRKQLYRNWELCIVIDNASCPDALRALEDCSRGDRNIRIWRMDEASSNMDSIRALLEDVRGEYIVLLGQDYLLPVHALYCFAAETTASPRALMLYSDEDCIDDAGVRSCPDFKPDWNPQYLLSKQYVGGLCAYRRKDVLKLEGDLNHALLADGYGLAFALTADIDADQVRHVPMILSHRHVVANSRQYRAGEASGTCSAHDEATVRTGIDTVDKRTENSAVPMGPTVACAEGKVILEQHLHRTGITAQVLPVAAAGGYRIRYAIPDPAPFISIIIPTRDGLDLLRRCIESIRYRSSYRRYEIIVVDNQSAAPATIAYLGELAKIGGISVVHYDQPFNFSAINNIAAQRARGDVLCLLNNDTEVIAPEWMEEMIGCLLQKDVGVVGAKLFYPDGRVQHGGDLVGVGGVANHAHSNIGHDHPGYQGRALLAQDLSAVTAACLMVWRSLYRQLGGLDEKHLPVAFNDVDFCLRVRAAGKRVVWTPHAQLYHHESVSRGEDKSPERRKRAAREARYMRERWAHVMKHDPFYNPNLNHERADFSLSHAPMVCRPWET